MVLWLKSELHSQNASALANLSQLQLRVLLLFLSVTVCGFGAKFARLSSVASCKGMKYTALGDCSSTDVLPITFSKHKLTP